jgi:hypothetical protein
VLGIFLPPWKAMAGGTAIDRPLGILQEFPCGLIHELSMT